MHQKHARMCDKSYICRLEAILDYHDIDYNTIVFTIPNLERYEEHIHSEVVTPRSAHDDVSHNTALNQVLSRSLYPEHSATFAGHIATNNATSNDNEKVTTIPTNLELPPTDHNVAAASQRLEGFLSSWKGPHTTIVISLALLKGALQCCHAASLTTFRHLPR